MSYRFCHLPKYCMRTGALHKVQHSRMTSASQLITHWQSGVGSRRCRWRLRWVALRNTWGAGPVNAALFKLNLKMNCCCTFYNIARPGWLTFNNCTLCPHCICFVFIWEQTATCATYSINWLLFIAEMKNVYSAVRTGALNKAVCASALKG